MRWRAHFSATYFARWRDSGLPGPAGYSTLYDRLRDSVDLPDVFKVAGSPSSGPLAEATLRDVYRFGVFLGHMVGRLLAIDPADIERRAAWCGQFNAGISLFDYVADETGRADNLLRQPPFDRLAGGATAAAPPPAGDPDPPVERLLRAVAADVLAQLETADGPPRGTPAGDSLWESLSQMMRAEVLMAKTRLDLPTDVTGLFEAASAKSAGPFQCMAEWMWLGSHGQHYPRASAAALGAALGACYWLVDDARDLWVDLDARRWNVFLLTASRKESGLFDGRFDDTSEIRLSRVLMSRGWLDGIVARAIDDLRQQIARTPARQPARDEVAGLIAVSMERWLQ